MDLKGIIPPIMTPFINDEVAYDKLEENIKRYNETNLSGYLLLGSNGEACFLSNEEKLRIVERARKVIPPEKKFIVGVNLESTSAATNLVNQIGGIGAEAALVSTPNYFKTQINSEVLYNHFMNIADRAAIPIVIYNMPRYTGINIPPEVIVRLAEHPNIIGIKDSSGSLSQTEEVINNAKADFQFIVGSALILYAALCMGAVGGIVAVSNFLPHICCQLYEETINENHALAKQLQFKIFDISKAVTITYGIAGAKAAMDMMGYYGGPPRKPLVSLHEEGRQFIKELLHKGGFLSKD